MALINWDPSYSVNIKQIDEQHRILIEMINDLYEAMNNVHERSELEKTINRLTSYAAIHFGWEEHYFDLFNFPKSAEHKREHKAFEKKIDAFENDFKAGRKNLSNDVISFLANWLINHIKVSDRSYVTYLNERGVK